MLRLILALLITSIQASFAHALLVTPSDFVAPPNPYKDSDFTLPAVTYDQPPPLVNSIKPNDFERKMDYALDGVDFKKLAESNTPQFGFKLTEVVHDTPADKAGMDEGSIVYQLDDIPCVDFEQFSYLRNYAKEPQKIYFVTSKDEKKEALFEPGNMGLAVKFRGAIWRPDVIFARQGPFDEKWNRLVQLAAKSWLNDPELAESALQQAMAAGFPLGIFADHLMAQVKLCANQRDAAFTFATRAYENALKAKQTPDPFLLRTLAEITALRGDYATALKLAEDNPKLFPDFWAWPIRNLARLTPAGERPKQVGDLAKNMLKDDWIYRIKLIEANPDEETFWSGLQEYGNNAFEMLAKVNYFKKYRIGPAMKDFEVRFALYTFRYDDEPDRRFASDFKIYLTKPDTEDQRTQIPFVIDFWPPNTILLGSQDLQIRNARMLPFYSSKKIYHPVRIVRVKGWVGIYIDGLPFYEGRAGEPDDKYYITFNICGAHARMEHFRFSELIDPADKDAAYFTKPNEKGLEGVTRLHRAVMLGYLDEVNALLKAGSDMNLPNYKNETALQMAIRMASATPENKEIAKILMADPKAQQDILYLAAQGDRKKTMEWIKEHPKLPDTLPYSPLHLAAQNDDWGMCQLLLERGISPDIKASGNGDAPIHWAVRAGNKTIVKNLIEWGADPKLKNNNGREPEELARIRKYDEIVTVLQNTPRKAAKPVTAPEDF